MGLTKISGIDFFELLRGEAYEKVAQQSRPTAGQAAVTHPRDMAARAIHRAGGGTSQQSRPTSARPTTPAGRYSGTGWKDADRDKGATQARVNSVPSAARRLSPAVDRTVRGVSQAANDINAQGSTRARAQGAANFSRAASGQVRGQTFDQWRSASAIRQGWDDAAARRRYERSAVGQAQRMRNPQS